MKTKHIVTLICSMVIIVIFSLYQNVMYQDISRIIRVGFIYVGDASNPYTSNFMKAQEAVEETYGENVELVPLYNVSEGDEAENAIRELVEKNCDIIFGTSYGYAVSMKKYAQEHPEIQFCMATGDNALAEPLLENYHTYMGHVYQGRYISGVVAGMKLQELLENGEITEADLLIGYVGAFPYAEVVSGYTAFFLGVRSIVPDVKMKVKYTNSWSDYKSEKKIAEELIEEGCVVISQHSDTTGPAVACEKTAVGKRVYHVGYNQNMVDVAPTTSLIGSRINWAPYMTYAVGAVLRGEKIEEKIDAVVNGTDAGAGFDKDWVQMFSLNTLIAAKGTSKKINEIKQQFIDGSLEVFKGDYIGVDPFNPDDTYDLNQGFAENKLMSAPTFHYVLKDVIIIEE